MRSLENLRRKFLSGPEASNLASAQVEEVEVEVAEGYTLTQFCDKIIDLFLNEKPKTKQWRKYLVFREEWEKYRESFYNRCRRRADAEGDPIMKQKLSSLWKKVKKVRHWLRVLLILVCAFHLFDEITK